MLDQDYMVLQIIKSLDTLIVAAWYFLSSVTFASGIDRLFGDFREEDYNDYSVIWVLVEIIVSLWLFLLAGRIVRVFFVDYLWSPFEGMGAPAGVSGYQRQLLKEGAGSVIFAFSLFSYAENLKKRIKYFGERVRFLEGGDSCDPNPLAASDSISGGQLRP